MLNQLIIIQSHLVFILFINHSYLIYCHLDLLLFIDYWKTQIVLVFQRNVVLLALLMLLFIALMILFR
jgi:hypothetical protein